jgi:hypothetical protein
LERQMIAGDVGARRRKIERVLLEFQAN